MKILMVNLAFLPESLGGTEFYTYHLSRGLMQRGYDVTVVAALDDVRLKQFRVVRTSFEDIRVLRIVNSRACARSFADSFLNPEIDFVFAEMVREAKPDLVHFQHLAYLTGGLPELVHGMGIPVILTLHDYWYMCFRSQLLRPSYGICPGPSRGEFCASCHHRSAPNPMAVARFPLLVRIMNRPRLRQRIASLAGRLPPALFWRARSWLFEEPRGNEAAASPDPAAIAANRLRYECFRRQFVLADCVLSPSAHLKRRYEEAGFEGITVFPLGYQTAEKVERLHFRGRLKIGFLGNAERHKGLLVMLRELSKIDDREKLEIHIHARPKDPAYYAEAVKLAKRLFGSRVVFHGSYRSDTGLETIFSDMHLLVFPSLWEENAPLVVREALTHGVPVIASGLGGIPEVVREGVNGLLFDPYEEGALAGRIRTILGDPRILENLGDGARNTVVESMDQHVEKICSLYQRTLDRWDRGAPGGARDP